MRDALSNSLLMPSEEIRDVLALALELRDRFAHALLGPKTEGTDALVAIP
jgi:hypothetical protein